MLRRQLFTPFDDQGIPLKTMEVTVVDGPIETGNGWGYIVQPVTGGRVWIAYADELRDVKGRK